MGKQARGYYNDDTPQAASVLCALTEQRAQEYREELTRLRHTGLDVVVQSSPEQAIAQVATMRPAVVVVGTTVGAMEWFEFVAVLAKDHGDVDAQVVVIPDKGDPFPPVLRTRDPFTGGFTGHYLTSGLHLDEIVAAIAAMESAGSGTATRPMAVGSGPIDVAKLKPPLR